jgi:hypothetical protein
MEAGVLPTREIVPPRFARIAGSFAIVVVVYWAYALLAVPWIEPSADLSSSDALADPSRMSPDAVDPRLKCLEPLFPPGVLDLQRTKMLESSDNAKLLLKNYANLPDGQIKIDPFIVVFPYEGQADSPEQRLRQSIILEAPGAMLKFDQPLEISHAKIGRLMGGKLYGPVTIRSQWKDPGPEDDLLISTPGDLELTEQTISTPQPVEFRWGPHSGSGHDMVIKLLAGQPRPGAETTGPNIAGIESFELRHVDQLHLEMGAGLSQKAGQPAQSCPVEINCRGPFRFDVGGHVATFNDSVDVKKTNRSGPADQLSCDVLAIHFVERPKSTSDAAGSFTLTAQRIEAQGNPVNVTAPSQDVSSRAGRFQYDLQAKSIKLDGGQEAYLRRGADEICARSLWYQSAGEGRLGRVLAQGPGKLRGRSPDRPDQQLEAQWRDELRLEPDQQKHRISLTGGAELNFHGLGQLQAREIFFWLTESPAAGNRQSRLRADSMAARNKVRMNSAQLSSKVEQLEVWFEEKGEGGRGKGEHAFSIRRDNDSTEFSGRRNDGLTDDAAGETGIPASAGSVVQASYTEAAAQPPVVAAVQTPVGTAVQDPVGTAVQLPFQPGPSQPGQPPAAVQRFEVSGRLLRAKVLLCGQQQAAISDLTIEDGVKFMETQTAQPNEQPLSISGDRLEAANATSPQATVTVVGRPARFDGRGLGLTGSNINLNRSTNSVRIDGPGQMTHPLSANGQGGLPVANDVLPAADGVLTVDWRRRMEFNGRTAQFEGEVVATTPQQVLRTETMKVHLQRPVSFTETNSQGTPPIEEIQCCSGVSLEQRTFDQQQQLSSHDRMELSDLVINRINGEIRGGPGWINSVFRGSSNSLGGGAIPGAPAQPNAQGPATDPTNGPAQELLQCVHVRFQDALGGNLHRRQSTFRGQVKMTYSPAENWDTVRTDEDPDKLGPQGMVLGCNQLAVVEMPLPTGKGRSIELEALGNATVDGSTFAATGHRITYAQAKDLLILEGDGRTDARLFRQLEAGADRSEAAAKRILYWLKTKQWWIDGAQSLQFGLPPSGNRTR